MSRSYIMLRSPHFTSSTNVPASSIPPVATTWSHLFQGAALRSFRGLGKLCSLQPYQRLWKGIENCLRNLIGGIPPSTLLLNIYLYLFISTKKCFPKQKLTPSTPPIKMFMESFQVLQVVSWTGFNKFRALGCNHVIAIIIINISRSMPGKVSPFSPLPVAQLLLGVIVHLCAWEIFAIGIDTSDNQQALF